MKVERFCKFERIVRCAYQFSESGYEPTGGLHPFDERNIHPRLQKVTISLFDDGHYAQATFEGYKFIENEIRRYSNSTETGLKLMMKVFAAGNPTLQLTQLKTESEKDEQKGYQFLFAGAFLAIRNPRGHEFGITDSPDKCLDHLSLASMLLKRLEESGYK